MNHRENPGTGSGRSSESNTTRKRILFWAKVAVSVLVLYLVFRGTDLAKISGHLAGSRKPLWTAAFLLMVLSQTISTFRWRILMRVLDFDFPWFRILKIYFTGMFFSLFLPTLVGGDGIKTFYIAGNWRRVPAALCTLLADRTIGFAAMAVFALSGLTAVRGTWPIWLVYGVVLSALFFYAFLLLLPRLYAPLLLLSRRLREIPSERLFVYWKKSGETGKAWLLSLGVHLCLVLSHICLGEALALKIPWAAWAVVYPVTAVVGFLPISLGGVGPREAAYVFLIGLFGVSRETALSLGIMWLSVVVANGLLGGLFYVFGGEMKVRDAIRT
jgi:uncharacterized membrane protein YbhN (UPF0104 family)